MRPTQNLPPRAPRHGNHPTPQHTIPVHCRHLQYHPQLPTTLLHGQDTDRELSTVSFLQAIQPVAMGGLGLRSSCDSRVGRFLLSTIRSIRHTSDDVTLPTPTDEDHPPLTIELPATIRRLFHQWQSTSPQLVKVFQHFQDHLHQLPPFSDTKIPDLPNYITCQAPLTDLAKKLYRRLVSTRLKDHASTLPIEDQLALRSLQNHLATVPLAHTTRRLPANRLHPADFRTLVGLSICDTIFDGPIPTTRCLCNHADLDKRGHHLFSCSEVHKTTAHHIIRDALHRIFKEIAPYVNSIGDAIVCKEHRGFHRIATHLRPPGDVSIHYGDTKTNRYSALIVDVTSLGFTPSSLHDVSQPTTHCVLKHHMRKEDGKFKGGRGHTAGHTFISGQDVTSSLNHQN
ncbi:MAG: hypothetical protein ACREOZ_04540, partial [Gloeomargaritales cyanobacterium]